MKRSLLTSSILVGSLAGSLPLIAYSQDSVQIEKTTIMEQTRIVELCICLDTSGSMDGLIDSARQKLWAIVNDLALAKPTPKLRVALLTYGNDGHNKENGWVKVQTPFTEDLDKVSQMLFALSTNGGTELVSRVIQSSIEELDWQPSDDTLKMIFVAGNESAEQDSEVVLKDICKQAISQGVMVNAIYCVYRGDDSSVATGWKSIAKFADGQYVTIDQDNGTIVIATPVDVRLSELSSEINETYIPFGEEGKAGFGNQQDQDSNAKRLNYAAAAQRAQTKGSSLYVNRWDLVDALKQKQVELAKVEEKDLPENMQSMTLKERQEYVDSMSAKRAEIQNKIAELTATRARYVTAEQLRQSASGIDGFDLAVRNAVKSQARSKGFLFKEIQIDNPDNETRQQNNELVYLIRVGDNWVSSDFAAEYGRMLKSGQTIKFDRELTRGTEEFKSAMQSIDKSIRDAFKPIEENVILRVDGKVWLIKPGA